MIFKLMENRMKNENERDSTFQYYAEKNSKKR